ncbi:hypothetical protein [Micromonospora sp. RTGN7]|uniref:hypothetical protein n=1 Tax=Micromonospora sp. RTGN7 TaxID=3016526 RepID=UPI0029FEFA61|nr:hypothetical protein [Micromonospora sp. RTGN7]
MAESSRPLPYRPGAVSLFFVAKAGVFAAGFWIWLLALVLGVDEAGGAHVLAAAGAVATTLVGVVLGARMALQRNAAVRHAELKRLLVDISWNAFTAAGNAETQGKVVPFPTMSPEPESSGRGIGERVSVFDRSSTNERTSGRDRGGNGERRR